MPPASVRPADSYAAGVAAPVVEAPTAAVSWGAIIAGAFTAGAVSLVLLALGAGVGLSSVSPWPGSGATLTTFTVSAAIWLIVVQWLSSGFGGYITGRLRTRWVGLLDHEMFFRDTAHGLVTWAVATIVGAALLASVVSSLVGGTTAAATRIASGAASGAAAGAATSATSPTGYFVDTLFRSDHPSASTSDATVRAETTRILVTDLANGNVPAADETYLATLVAAKTGLSQADAKTRVDAVIGKAKAAEAKARQLADKARKASAEAAFFAFFSLLIGAFIAATAAAIGGRHRHPY